VAKPGRKPTEGPWVDAIAAESRRDLAVVEAFLLKHDLAQPALTPMPVDVTVKAVSFSGERPVGGGLERFSFDWPDLAAGLWLVGSDRNSAGKTSLIDIIRWLLRGSPPKTLPPDVRSWLRNASLEFEVGGVPYRVSVDCGADFRAELLDFRSNTTGTCRLKVDSPPLFEIGMAEFMMDGLQLDPIVAWRKGNPGEADGHAFPHGWLALFSAFHIGTSYVALLGDEVVDGLQPRLLNMFAGFPHASLVNRIFVIQKEVSQRSDSEARVGQAVADHARARAARLRKELGELEERIGHLGEVEDLLERMRSSSDEAARLYAELPGARSRLSELRLAAASARDAHNADRLALQDFNEAAAAHRVFRALDPKCCPRCDQVLAESRRERESRELSCMVCGEQAPPAEEGAADDRKARLVEAVEAGRRGRDQAGLAEAVAAKEVKRLEDRLSALDERLRNARAEQAAASEGARLRSDREIIKARLADAEEDVRGAAAAPPSEDAVIAAACEKVARARLAEEQREALAEVSTEVQRFLHAFGFTAAEEVELGTSGHLKLKKGGVPVTFTGLSEGEKLRAKVAVVLSLMLVAQRRGVGRHPGLLFLDTPGAQELREADLEAFARGLAVVAAELPTLQVFIATRHVKEFASVVPPKQARVAVGEEMVW
jgi:hypothetical protein